MEQQDLDWLACVPAYFYTPTSYVIADSETIYLTLAYEKWEIQNTFVCNTLSTGRAERQGTTA